VAEAYGDLINEAFNSLKSNVVPKTLREVLGGVNEQFAGYEQQDSAELLSYIIDTLHEDLNRVKEKEYIEYPTFRFEKDSYCAEKFWELHVKRNNSVITDLFDGIMKTTTTCKACSSTCKKFEAFHSLSLPVPGFKYYDNNE
jgi:ubiquitin C-terminal hydrolase